ncbi:MAG: beta strand repeat-containing protein [Acidimicrobiales bacterium]
MRSFSTMSRPSRRAVGILLGGLSVVGLALLFAFGGAGAGARSQSWGPNDPDPPFGLFETESAGLRRAAEAVSGGPASSVAQVGTPAAGASRGAAPTGDTATATSTAKDSGPVVAAAMDDATVPVGTLPTGVAVNATRAYVANSQSNSVSVIDLTAGPPSVITTVPVGAFPVGVALSGDNSQVYVTNYNGSSLSIISTATNAVTNTVAVGSRPNGVIRVGASVYVANLTGNSISVVNPATATVTNTVTLGGAPLIAPSGLAANAGGTRLYASDARNGKLLVLDLTVSPPALLSSSTTVGSFPAYVAVAGTTGYVANPGSNSVSVVNLAVSPPTVTATVPVGTSDYGIVAQPSLNQVFVTNSGSNNLSVINTTSNTAVGTFPTGTKPNAIALTPDGTTAVLSNQGSNTVSILHVNQKPVNTVPGAQTVNANGTGSSNTLVFSVGNGNAISTTDDAGTNPVKVTLSVSHGTLTLSTTVGLTFNSGANGTATMAVTGTLTDINAALAGLTYTPTTAYIGADTLTMTTDDQGNEGIGQVQTDQDTVAITVQNVAPVVNNVSYTGAVGNTIFGVGITPAQPETHASGTVLSGSSDPNNDTLTAGPATITSANGGTVTMASNGTFTYVSAPGYTGSDTFTFTVSDGHGGSTNGTATVAVANRVWYANNALGVNGNGTSVSPFNTLANLRGVGDVDSPGDFIFLYTGAGNYAGGLPLEANQQLIGQPQDLVVNSVTLWTGAGTNPTITNAAGVGIVLAQNNTIRRVNVANTSSAGINGSGINTTDIGPNMSISNSGGAGFSLFGGGSGNVTFAANITHSSSAGRSVFIGGRTGGTVTISGSVNDSAGGVQTDTNTGATINFTGGLTLSGPTETFKATGGGTVNVTGTNTLSSTAVAALTVTSTTIGASGLTFQSINQNGGTNGIVLSNTASTGGLTVTGTGTAGSGGTIQNTTGAGISLTSVGGVVTLTDMATTGVSGADVLLNGGGANFTFNGPITNTAGRSVDVSNRTGGTALFSGAISDTGTGINLSSNTGATINFTGGLSMSTGSNPAFAATGGGTVNVTGSANTIATTTGVALNVANTTIGASNLNFRSISAGTAATGPTSGIILDSTGSSGGLTVSGTGAAGTGGTIQKTSNSGIQANSTRNLNLSWMTIANNGDAVNEGGVRLTDVFGTGQLTSSSVTGASEDNVYISNGSGTLTSFTVQGPNCFVGNNSLTTGNIGVGAFATGTANMTVTVNNCSFAGNRTETLRGDTADSSTLNATFTNNTITAGTGGNNQGNIGVNVSTALTSTLTYLVQNNKIGTDGITNAPLMNHGINVFAAGSSTATGKVLSNTIRMAGAGMSGTGIRLFQQDSGKLNANVDSNTVSNVGFDFGIDATDNGSGVMASTGQLNVAVTNNNASTLSAAINAIRVRGRRDTTTCARITGNTATTNGGAEGLSVSQANTAFYNLEAPPPGSITAATAATRLGTLNPGAVGVSASAATSFTAVAAGSCTSIPT